MKFAKPVQFKRRRLLHRENIALRIDGAPVLSGEVLCETRDDVRSYEFAYLGPLPRHAMDIGVVG